MHIALTGATGFLGSALIARLRGRGDQLSAFARDPAAASRRLGADVATFARWEEAPRAVDAVINLAGAPLIGPRWTARNCARLRASRIGTTQALGQWLARLAVPPRVLLSGSAIGYYGYSETQAFGEDAPPGSDFGARLCADWEGAARAARPPATRLCLLRTGVVLHPSGGALARMLPAFRLGLGGPIGSGRQWLSWIHLDDWLAAVLHLLGRDDLDGPFNLVAPEAVRNAEFARTLAAALNRPGLLRVPAWVLGLAVGEGARLLLEGQQVLPRRLAASGFSFAYPQLGAALAAGARKRGL